MTRFGSSLPMVLGFLLLAGTAQGAPSSPGQKLYESRCASCHGLDAKGSPSTAKALKADPASLDLTRSPIARRSESALRELVAKGHGRMPKQTGLTPKEVRELVRYLHSLQRDYASREP